MKKITVLILADGMTAGGTERQIVELLKGLQDHGNVATIIGILMKGGALETDACRFADIVMPVSQHRRFDVTLAFSLIRYAKTHHIDIIHTFGVVSDLSGVIAGKILKIPVVNGSIRSARVKLNRYDRFSKLLMPLCAWIVANSRAGMKAFGVEHFKNTSVIYNGIDTDRFRDIEPAPIGDDTICMVGNFTPKKDQAALIHALPLVKEEFPQARLVLVGRGKTLYRCQQLVKSLQQEKSVKFFSDTNDPAALIKGSKVCVLLSPNGEGISNAILEYMALAKPVVATDIGGNRELVKTNETGLLIKNHCASTIANAIRLLLRDPDKAKKLGLAGKKRIERQFSLERMVNRYIDLYCNVIRIFHAKTAS